MGKTTDLILDIQLKYENFLLELRMLMIRLLSSCYNIFKANHNSIKRQLAYKTSSIKLRLIASRSLIRAHKDIQSIISKTTPDINRVLNLVEETLLEKTNGAISTVRNETKKHLLEKQKHRDTQSFLRDK